MKHFLRLEMVAAHFYLMLHTELWTLLMRVSRSLLLTVGFSCGGVDKQGFDSNSYLCLLAVIMLENLLVSVGDTSGTVLNIIWGWIIWNFVFEANSTQLVLWYVSYQANRWESAHQGDVKPLSSPLCFDSVWYLPWVILPSAILVNWNGCGDKILKWCLMTCFDGTGLFSLAVGW